ILVIAIGLYLVVKNEMKAEKIAKRIEALSEQTDYHVSFDNIDYSLSLSGLNAVMYDVNIDSDIFDFISRKVNLNLNIFRFLFKEIVINNMTIYDGVLILKNIRSDSLIETNNNISLISDIFLKDCMIIYDTLTISEINGKCRISGKDNISITGKLSFLPEMKYLNKLGKCSSSFAVLGKNRWTILLNRMDFENGIRMNGDITITNDSIDYEVNIKSNDLSIINQLIDTDFRFNGNSELSISGYYMLNDSLKENLKYIKNIDIDLNTAEIQLPYEEIKIRFLNGSTIKSDLENIDLNLNISVFDRIYNIIGFADYDSLINKRISSQLQLLKSDISIIEEFNNDILLKGNIDIDVNTDFIIDSMHVLSHLILNTAFKTNFNKIEVKIDTYNFILTNGTISKMRNPVKYSFSSEYRNMNVSVKGECNVIDSMIKADVSVKGELNNFINDFYGKINIDSRVYYNLKKNALYGNAALDAKNIKGKGFNDIINVSAKDISFNGFEHIDAKNINITGTFFKSNIKKLTLLNKDKIKINMDMELMDVNLDSLFPISDSAQSIKEKSIVKPDIPNNLEVYTFATCNRAIFRGEDISNISFYGYLRNDSLVIDSLYCDLVKGNAEGNLLYFPENGYVYTDLNMKNIEISEFLSRHPISPYNVGGRVNAKSQISFHQDSLKESVNGLIITEIKGGYMLAPNILRNISNVIRYSMNDTFFFDNMYGEFNVKDQAVFFDEFFMEKNGHLLVYGGNVDFEKQIFVDGKYIIDMRIADTGVFEDILKNAGFEEDSVYVDFEILGDYKLPVIDIKSNSITAFLKSKHKNLPMK
ncbi:hypothetical protein KAU15_06500, partial [candidate division WOR-3 bacterium]|nr:hypothetical protein [candidate division WOR-3 bacterium]